MRIQDIICEAGEPKDPSRRKFIKGLGAAGALAAAPTSVVKALAPAAATAAPATAAAKTALIDKLFTAALDYGRREFSDGDYEPGDNDYQGEQDWDPENESLQGDEGQMPWNSYYSIGKTPQGRLFLHTTNPDETSGVFVFEKGGKIHTMEIYRDRHGWSEVTDSSYPEDQEIFYQLNVNDDDPMYFIDAIIDGDIEKYNREQPIRANQEQEMVMKVLNKNKEEPKIAAKDVAADLAGHAAKTQVGGVGPGTAATFRQLLDKLVPPTEPEPQEKDMGQAQRVDEPQALPAPKQWITSQADIMAQIRDKLGRDLSDDEYGDVQQAIKQHNDKIYYDNINRKKLEKS